MCTSPDVAFWNVTSGDPQRWGWWFGVEKNGPTNGPFQTFDDAIEAYQKTLGG